VSVRLAIEQWAPEYGAPLDGDALDATKAEVAIDVEIAAGAWAPRSVSAEPLSCVLFVDGVRRVDAMAWLTDDDGVSAPALLASYAAGVVRCRDTSAALLDVMVGRGLFTASSDAVDLETAHGTWRVGHAPSSSPEALSLALQTRMGATEAAVVSAVAADADLVVVDGPLRAGVPYPPCSVGYVKTHATSYLGLVEAAVIGRLQPGQRTPLFCVSQPLRSSYSWYLRLPGAAGHPWAGVVRCEVDAAARSGPAAVAIADAACATIPRFASQSHKDPRAPQNLVPIGGLEHRLRHLLGDRDLLYRGLLRAAS